MNNIRVDVAQLAKDVDVTIRAGKMSTEEGLNYMAFYSRKRISELADMLVSGTITKEEFDKML